jgi:hypothetical protein
MFAVAPKADLDLQRHVNLYLAADKDRREWLLREAGSKCDPAYSTRIDEASERMLRPGEVIDSPAYRCGVKNYQEYTTTGDKRRRLAELSYNVSLGVMFFLGAPAFIKLDALPRFAIMIPLTIAIISWLRNEGPPLSLYRGVAEKSGFGFFGDGAERYCLGVAVHILSVAPGEQANKRYAAMKAAEAFVGQENALEERWEAFVSAYILAEAVLDEDQSLEVVKTNVRTEKIEDPLAA